MDWNENKGNRNKGGYHFRDKDEFKNVLGAIKKALKTYQMEYRIRLSLWVGPK